ncbi:MULTISPECIES: PLP-dependent aminotransferase family protein [Streptomyces]|uniref:PLP-dependent aminotransferase family protein n=1 Tax=Streptomyces koelreuteriae TaxID=2838015 RepID=A0ABX8FT19_9ACTN|nr:MULTISPECIES: PLP-dependent aminotransferase family protein [Streptomyces]QWB24358.1 PLP-dependent aminotransferase family protein [Streptomyces koelreuteriae]UUA07361.1 PLP-dependent aminotransferase family protein [Streptomyces koelreuteriae]UUA14991.1 PLP-dependent aminotransferase family protein [Streptomyces sp. CRCS-T-1]
MGDYRRIADRIADDIATGRLRPGQRLPPQRAFARRRGIAPSTAGRVYSELVRRGLVVGEVGRGTFVRAGPTGPAGQALAEPGPTGTPVNLELNYPSAPGQPELLAPVLAPLLRPDVLAEALLPAAATGTPQARQAAAALLTTPGWRPAPDRLLFTGNARQAIAAVLASLVRPGGRVGVEQLTYPLVKEIAARLGITLVPLAGDRAGLLPEAIAAAHRSAPLSALYVQPTLHNPTSLTTSRTRRLQLAQLIHHLDLPIVEDRIWSFLHGPGERNGAGDPLAAHAPALAHVVDGLSKRVAPGLTVGFLVVPPQRVAAVADAVRSGGWSAARFALEAAVRWASEGTVERLVEAKRADAARRQRILAEELAGFAVRSDPRAYFAWWELPSPWRADTFTAAAAAHGIAVTPGPAFAVSPGHTPDAVRLGLASAPEGDLRRALRTLGCVAARRGGGR